MQKRRQPTRRFFTLFLFLTIFSLTIVLALFMLQPPRALPDTAEEGLFSAGRAMHHLKVIASRPHPVGSAAHETVRDYLIGELQALGLEPQVHTTTSVNGRRAAAIENIVAMRKGTGNTKAVLISAHYDSRALAPGASDNGYAVAAILETLRALQAHPPLMNDLIVFFIDGEELGMLGAKAFAEDHPLAGHAGLVLNFDARGASGASIMFETNPENGWVVREYNRGFKRKLASSLTHDVYRFMPYMTDFNFLLEKVPAGLNFANIGSVEFYHTVYDDLDHASQRTIQSTGSKMLDAVLHFGNMELNQMHGRDVVYFSFLTHWLIIYPDSWIIPLAMFATLLFLFVIVLGVRRAQVQCPGILIGFLVLLTRMITVVAAVFFLWKWLGPLHPEFGLYELQYIHQGDLYLVAFILLGVSAGVFFHRFMAGKIGLFNLALGGLTAWLILTWVTAFLIPGGSYLFVWPLITTLIAFALILGRKEVTPHSLRSMMIISLCMTPGVFFFSHMIVLLYESLTLIIAAGLAGLVILLLGTLQLPLGLLVERKPWLVPTGALIIAAGLVLAAFVQRTPTVGMPKPDTVFYCLDADSNKACWATWDRAPDEFTEQFFSPDSETKSLSEFFLFDYYSPFPGGMVLSNTAPVVPLGSPETTIVRDTMDSGVRRLTMRIDSSRRSYLYFIDLGPRSGIRELSLNGKALPDNSGHKTSFLPLIWSGSAKHPVEITVAVLAGETLTVSLVEMTAGLPESLLSGFNPRPARMIPLPGYMDASLVRTTWTIPPAPMH